MSVQKIINPGFGIGAALGTPTTLTVGATTTVNLTSANSPIGVMMSSGMVAGQTLAYYSTTNGVTASWTVGVGAVWPTVWNDGGSLQVISTTTAANITLISPV